MTRRQQALYRGKNGLWVEACRVQGWDPTDDDKRRAITNEAARKINPNSKCTSTAHLNEDQITALFKLLIALANPLDVAAQRASENPIETAELDARKRCVHEIEKATASAGLHRNYVRAIAHWYCREHQVTNWEDLPSAKLRLLVITVKERAAKILRNRPKTIDHPDFKTYGLRPRELFKPRPAAPL